MSKDVNQPLFPGPELLARQSIDTPDELDTSAGRFSLQEFRMVRGDHEWKILHTSAVLSRADESRVIGEKDVRLPYGVALWPSAIALVHEIASRPGEFSAKRVLELGAGTGLPGIVAASFGASVLQTDRDELALHLCRRNSDRNKVGTISHRLADWTNWDDPEHYDWIIGADILYAESLHTQLRKIFETNLASGGRVLIADPFRSMSIRFLETLEQDGWRVGFNKWEVGDTSLGRPVGVFDLSRPSG